MKTKTKRKLKKHVKKVRLRTLVAHKHVKRVKRKGAKLANRKIVNRKTGQRLIRAFFILIAAVMTGSLAFTVNHTKPTVEIEVRTNVAKAVEQLNPKPFERPANQVGSASWYALGLPAPDALTCASTTYPRGTYLLVTSLRNGKNVICLVNDYGPQAWTKRVIDLSRGSFRVIEDLSRGTVPVEIRVVPKPSTSIKLPFPANFTASVGYSACEIIFAANYCDQNRQDNKQF